MLLTVELDFDLNSPILFSLVIVDLTMLRWPLAKNAVFLERLRRMRAVGFLKIVASDVPLTAERCDIGGWIVRLHLEANRMIDDDNRCAEEFVLDPLASNVALRHTGEIEATPSVLLLVRCARQRIANLLVVNALDAFRFVPAHVERESDLMKIAAIWPKLFDNGL